MKNLFSFITLLLFISTALSAKSIYVQVMSVSQDSNLFNISYRLNELGYKMNISEKNGLYKVYSGPFDDRWSANLALKDIKKNIASDAYIVELNIGKEKIAVVKETKKVKIKPQAKESMKSVLVTKPKKVEPVVYHNRVPTQMRTVAKAEDEKSPERVNNFFLGLNLGTSKFDLQRENVNMSSVGYNYGLESRALF